MATPAAGRRRTRHRLRRCDKPRSRRRAPGTCRARSVAYQPPWRPTAATGRQQSECSSCSTLFDQAEGLDHIARSVVVAHVAGAAADVLAQGVFDLAFQLAALDRLTLQLFHQHGGGVDIAGSAVAALEGKLVDELLLDRV